MASPSENLARSLEALKALQENNISAIRGSDISRVNRERLLSNGFIQEVIKGWYITSDPSVTSGDSTPWYSSFWKFCSQYLDSRFKNDWSLSPEQSLLLHGGNSTVPRQLMIRSTKASNNVTNLLHDTSLLDLKANPASKASADTVSGVRVYNLPSSLVLSSPAVFHQNPTDVRVALMQIRDASEILPFLLDEGRSVVAGRLAGAFINIGRKDIAGEIVDTFKMIGTQVNVTDPFKNASPVLSTGRVESAASLRLKVMWENMRDTVIDVFDEEAAMPLGEDAVAYLSRVDDIYTADAYHSLSIEGYSVSQSLIDKVRDGSWNPYENQGDMDQRNALAARGYWEAFSAVKKSIKDIFNGDNPGGVAEDSLNTWYRSLFAPSVSAGILTASDLAGYRNMQVYIKGSKHVPLSCNAVRDAMRTLFELLKEEKSSAVRAVLGHFMLVYIHPFMDGNGRTGRFLMNTMLASGGHEWKVIPVNRRNEYMKALECASVDLNIKPFAEFIRSVSQCELT